MARTYDVVVVGSGPGGYVAAIRAAQLGLRTAVVEKDRLGGVCLNWGCIPTKALLHGADIAHALTKLDPLGFNVTNIDFDLTRLIGFSRAAADRLSVGVAELLKHNGVEVFAGVARLAGKGVVEVGEPDRPPTQLRADHVVIATGARPRMLPGMAPDGNRIWTHVDALMPTQIPKSLLIVGSGPIGIEFASFYNDFGTDVTMVEVAPHLMPSEDDAVSSYLHKRFARRKVKLHTSCTVSDVKVNADCVVAAIDSSTSDVTTLTVDRLLVAAGTQGNVENLGLESLGVEVDAGFIRTDQWCRTNVVGVYAIGDVAGVPCLAHKASHEGLVCINRIAGLPHVRPLDRQNVPRCTYSRPQVASLGLTEAQARADGRSVQIGLFDLRASGKAVAIGETGGFVKTILDESTGEVLGVHMVGPQVTEHIHGFGIARSLEATGDDLAEVVFAHPTLSEAMHESVLAALGRPLNM